MTAPYYGWLSILPPLMAIVLAIRSKQVFLSLFAGVFLGYTILAGGNPLKGVVDALEACVEVFGDAGNTKVILFSCMVGALITFTQYSGGMEGFVQWVTRRGWVATRRQAGLLAFFTGLVVFVESSICVLVAGSVSRPLFDKLKVSREKLAYICDSTSAPKCILIPLNAWGAFIIGLLQDQHVGSPVQAFVASMPFNFYAIIAIALVLWSVLSQKDLGPMAAAERRVQAGKLTADGAEPLVSQEVLAVQPKPGIPLRAVNMVLPIGVMVIMMPVGLLITGHGNLMQGSGSTSVFWAVLLGLAAAAVAYRLQGLLTVREIMDQFMKGVGGLVSLAALMMLAFAIGATCRALGTGPYVAGLADAFITPKLVPALLFLISCGIAFATGTSWGTFAIMIPIAMPMVEPLGLHMGMTLAAVLGGGVFGDHCSPISDTTIISSMASACDHIDHVATQLPYALSAAGVSLLCYVVLGFLV
ncbi:MAG TPA: Na+/H+ antiporter NhaC family protein [bacterium]|nr:Na+/H+ antiporter NhaC family protein [bacterium]